MVKYSSTSRNISNLRGMEEINTRETVKQLEKKTVPLTLKEGEHYILITITIVKLSKVMHICTLKICIDLY